MKTIYVVSNGPTTQAFESIISAKNFLVELYTQDHDYPNDECEDLETHVAVREQIHAWTGEQPLELWTYVFEDEDTDEDKPDITATRTELLP
ncbi:MAG: hypothetical protein ACYDHY_06920 [Acidiferrobacterales bacterium]